LAAQPTNSMKKTRKTQPYTPNHIKKGYSLFQVLEFREGKSVKALAFCVCGKIKDI
jgi:hypothetical protein